MRYLMKKIKLIVTIPLLLLLCTLRGESYGTYTPYTTRTVKAEEPKKEDCTECKSTPQSSNDSKPDTGEENPEQGDGVTDSSKETITLIYPSDAQLGDGYLAFETRKAEEPVEEGSAPIDRETPIGSIRNIGDRLKEIRESLDEQKASIDGLLKLTHEINSAKSAISDSAEKKDTSLHSIAVKVACWAVGVMTFLIVWTIFVIKAMNFISVVFSKLVEKGIERTTESLRTSGSKKEENNNEISI